MMSCKYNKKMEKICFMLSIGITEDAKRDAIKKMEEIWDAE